MLFVLYNCTAQYKTSNLYEEELPWKPFSKFQRIPLYITGDTNRYDDGGNGTGKNAAEEDVVFLIQKCFKSWKFGTYAKWDERFITRNSC